MNNRKILIIALVAVMGLGMYYFKNLQRPNQLTIGLFAGNPWSNTNFDIYEIVDEVIETYQQEYDVEVEYLSGILQEDYNNYINSLIVAGKEPDIYIVLDDNFSVLSSINALTSLDDYMADSLTFDIHDYYGPALEAGQKDGVTYALPIDCDLDLLFVNESLLEQEGVTIDGPLTLDQFYKICSQVTKDTNGDGKIDQFGFCNYQLEDVIDTMNMDIFQDGAVNLELDRTKAAIEYYAKLAALNQGYGATLDDFDSGKVVFAKLPFSQFRTYRFYPYNLTKYSTFQWDCINLPTNSGKAGKLDTLLVGISARCQNKGGAFKFLELLSNERAIQQNYFETSQGISPLNSVVNSDASKEMLNENTLDSDFDVAVIDRGLVQANVTPTIKNYQLIEDQLNLLLEGALTTDQDIDLYLINVEKQINEIMIQQNT